MAVLSREDGCKALRSFFETFSPIPDEEWEAFVSHVIVKDLKAGQFLLRVGDPPTMMGYVLSGLLVTYYESDNRREFVRNFSCEQQMVCSYSSAISRVPSNYNIQALEDSRITLFSTDAFLASYDRHVCWERIGRKLLEHYFSAYERRTHSLIAMTSQQRYQDFKNRYGGLEKRIQRKHLASFLGITPQSLCRLGEGVMQN